MDSIALFTTALGFLGLGIMVYNLWMVISTRASLPGGVIGAKWNTLFWLVLFFAIGYLVTPFSSMLDATTLRIVASFVFLFGAIYVAVTIHLIRRIIRELAG